MIATKPYIFQRWKQTILILLAAYSSPLMSAAQITPLIPPSLPQNEEALLLDALNTEPEILEGGYRQYDLIAARLNTWNDGPRNITVRLLLPPEDGVPPFPLVAYIHGGGFIGGSSKIKILDQKSRFGYAMRALLDEGFAVASMDYRQAREAGWPAPVSDVLCGLRFLSKHAAHWKIDARSIGVEEEWLFAAAVSGQQHAQPPIETESVHALSIDPEKPGPLPVKTLIPNLGGYYGLGGSVMEWTASAGESRAYFTAPNGDKRILAYPIARGGAWSSMPHLIRLALRKQQRHGNRQGDLGFRIAIGGGPGADNWLKKIEQHDD